MCDFFEQCFNFDDILFVKFLNIIHFSLFFASKINLTIEQYRFIIVLVSYLIAIFIYFRLNNEYDFQNKNISFCYLFLLTVQYYSICFGYRTGFGLVLFVLSIYFIQHRSYVKGLVLILLSCITHLVFILNTIVFFFSKMINMRIKLKYIFMLSITFYSLSSILYILSGYNELLDSIVDIYVMGKWGSEYKFAFGKIIFVLLNSVFPLAYMYFLYFKNRSQIQTNRFVDICFILAFLYIPFFILLERHMIIVTMILGFYLIEYSKLNIFKKIEIQTLNLLLIITFLVPFYIQRYEYKAAKIQNIIYSSLPQIWSNTYNDKAIFKYMDSSGDFEPI